MKKLTLLSLIPVLSFSSFSYAGGMGDSGCCTGFVALEGGYTRNSISGYNFTIIGANTTTITASESNQPYSVRLAGGVLSMFDDDWGFTGELGWGYYGKTTENPNISGILTPIPATFTNSQTIYGVDALLGVAFIQPYYSLSFKVGALFENMINNTSATFTPAFAPVFNSFDSKDNKAAVLPELKLGAAYNFNPNWALTGAYMFALGGSPKTSGSFNLNTGAATLSINNQNPTMNSLLLGVQYTA